MQAPFRFAEQAGLFELWTRKRGARRMPGRGDLSTVDLRPWLGEMHLIAVLDEGNDFRYLVFGTDIARYYDVEMTRRLVSEWPDPMRDAAMRTYSLIVREACPYLVRQNEQAQGRLHSSHRLVLPLSTDGRTVDHLLTHLHMIPANAEDAGIFYHALPPGPAGAPSHA
jgi:hypothetical protein